MIVPFLDLKAQLKQIEPEIKAVIDEVVTNTDFINGKYNKLFCEAFADFTGVKHCIGVGNGTDALEVALLALGIRPDDEVIVPANSFVATAEAVSNVGAKVIFADCLPDFYTIDPADVERKITPKTKCIIPVHLYGQAADLQEICHIAKKHNLCIIEDAAQAHGATFQNKPVGTIGDVGIFSFYPGKNLGAYGDGGAITTNDTNLAEKMTMIANHGRIDKYNHKIIGRNSRLDHLQAAILYVKIKYLKSWNDKRIENANLYNQALKDILQIKLPVLSSGSTSVYHLYVVRATTNRDGLADFLKQNGITTGIHYPIGLPFLQAYSHLNHTPEDFPVTYQYQSQILSLPMYCELQPNQISYVAKKIEEFYTNRD